MQTTELAAHYYTRGGAIPKIPRFQRTLFRNGMNVYALQRIMGHPGLSVLRRYLALLDDDLQEAHRRFGAVDQLLAQGVRGPRAFDRPAWVRVISIEGKKSIKRVV